MDKMQTGTVSPLFEEFNKIAKSLNKLREFIRTIEFEELDKTERANLLKQLRYMQDFCDVLLRRYLDFLQRNNA